MRQGLKRFWEGLKETGRRFMEIDPLTEAGSIAFTTIFAVPGVFIITLTVASIFYSPQDVQEALYTQAGSLVGENTGKQLKEIVGKSATSDSTLFSRILGIVALVVSATAAFAALQSSLNKVWRVKAKAGRAIWRYVFSRLISLGLIASFGFMLLISLVLDAVLVAMGDRLGGGADAGSVLAGIAGMMASFGVVTLVFAAVFKFLPDVKVPWRVVWGGALFTAALFSVGKYLIGLYIAKTSAGEAFGAGGAVIIILLWVYWSAVLLLFGAQYTEVKARRNNLKVEPSRQAEFVEAQAPRTAERP